MTRIQRDAIGYLLVIGFCIVMLAWAIPTYTPAYPGYGAPPDLVADVAVGVMLFMAGLSLLRIVVATYLDKPIPDNEREFPEDLDDGAGFTQVGRVNLRHLAGILVPSLLLVVAIEYVGYAIASLVYLVVIQYMIGSRRWLQLSVVAVSLVAVLYIVMRYGFGVPVPGPQLF